MAPEIAMPSDDPKVLILATLETKAEEAGYFQDRLAEHGVEAFVVDLSLQSKGVTLGGFDKTSAMDETAHRALDVVTAHLSQGVNAVVGLGGGTGAEIILKVLRAMPITFPKVLITTLPFDPRLAIADNSIVLVPTLADLCGLNATLREVLENAAAMTAGLCRTRRKADACVQTPSVGITALGATDAAVSPLVQALRARGKEATVFHANGYGGAAFSRFARRGAFNAIIDLTPHEMTRLHIAGSAVAMPDRFATPDGIARIVLPGALNFIGLGQKALVPPDYLKRAHYAHSGLFTHVKLTPDEMADMARRLAHSLNQGRGPRSLIVPMGGFSHQDRPGGAIEDPGLRGVFLDTVKADLSPHVDLIVRDAHLFDPQITQDILTALQERALA